MSDPVPVRLQALDADDLATVSTLMQDAVLRTADLSWQPKLQRLALVARRFDWEGAGDGHNRRRLTALHFDRVQRVRRLGIDPALPERILNLLAITVTETEPPAAELTLTFSGGAALRLTVECIEAQLKDLGGIWESVRRPDHNLSSGGLPDGDAGKG